MGRRSDRAVSEVFCASRASRLAGWTRFECWGRSRSSATAVVSRPRSTRLLAALLVAGLAARLDELVEAIWGEVPRRRRASSCRSTSRSYGRSLPPPGGIVTRPAATRSAPSWSVDAMRFEPARGGHRGTSRGEPRPRRVARRPGARALARPRLRRPRGRRLPPGRRPSGSRSSDWSRTRSGSTRSSRSAPRGVVGEILVARRGEPASRAPATHDARALPLWPPVRGARALRASRARLDELGLEPGAELRELQRRILQQDVRAGRRAGGARRRRRLPEPPNRWSARARADGAHRPARGPRRAPPRAHRSRRERQDAARARGGPPGSALVRERCGAGRARAAPRADPRRPDDLAASVSRRCRHEDPSEALAAVAAQDLLLLVDNAEHLREAAPALAELLSRAPT